MTAEAYKRPEQVIPGATSGTTILEVSDGGFGIDVEDEELVSGVLEFFSGKIGDVIDATDDYDEVYEEIWTLFELNGTRVSQRVVEITDGLTGLWEVEDPAEKKAEIKRLLIELSSEVIQTPEVAINVLHKYTDGSLDVEVEDES